MEDYGLLPVSEREGKGNLPVWCLRSGYFCLQASLSHEIELAGSSDEAAAVLGRLKDIHS